MEEKNEEIDIEKKNNSLETELELSLETIPEQDEENIVNIEIENQDELIDKTNDSPNHLENLSNFVNTVKDELIVRNERDKYKDETIQRMSKQIDIFEKGVFENIKKELILEIISFYDMFLNFQEKFNFIENSELQSEIDFLEMELNNIIFNNGIDEIEEITDVEIDRSNHRIKKVEPTNVLSQNNKIKSILKKGYLWNKKIIRKQEVVVYKYKESENE
ncbi:MAG: nucleotide exchange factor GrpE [Bacteroidetes bacterium]|nr:nucleotide exchange factor GrpE [Bacteroidota bacterium]